ncbi:MAG: ABC transporter permease subunit [Treponema sp.]|jgi:NitT/TauT family transport system permease protein|nr:ABC transporter permease subunit [Treponema sp.]
MTKTAKRALSIVIIALFFGLWEGAARFEGTRSALLPPFSRVLANLYVLFRTRNLAVHIGVSLCRVSAGIALGALFGIPLGFLLGTARERWGICLGALWGILAQVNPFLLYHGLISFLGIGETVKVSILCWGCLWPVAFNTAGGVEAVDRTLLKAGRAFGGGKGFLFFTVILPASAPRICGGIRIAAGYALLMLTAAEILGARSGLGWLVLTEQVYFRMANLFSIVLISALLGVSLDACLGFIQKKIIPYELEGYINSSEN